MQLSKRKRAGAVAMTVATWLIAMTLLTMPMSKAHAEQSGNGATDVTVDTTQYVEQTGEIDNETFTAPIASGEPSAAAGKMPQTGDLEMMCAIAAFSVSGAVSATAIALAATHRKREGEEDAR